MVTIGDALRAFVEEEQEREPSRAEEIGLVLDNLVGFLEGYGHQYLDEAHADNEFGPDESMGEIDERPNELVETTSPDIIPASLAEFLYYWNIRKFMGDEDDARATGLVMARLMEWLAEQGWVGRDEAGQAADLARAAAVELPRARRLSDVLYDVAKATPSRRRSEPEDVVDDFLEIVRIEPGRLWLARDVGPIDVPAEASELAELGWEVNLVASKHSGVWSIEEVGNVYPRSLGLGDDELDDEELDDDWEALPDELPRSP